MGNRNSARNNPSHWHKTFNNPENKLFSIRNAREINAIFPIVIKYSCLLLWSHTQYSSLQLNTHQ